MEPWGVVDVENAPNGDVIGIGASVGGEVALFDGWDEWLVWAWGTGTRCWYAHNGGGWDWTSLVRWAVDRGMTTCDVGRVGSRSVFVKLAGFTLLDSWCLTQCSLADFAARMGIVDGKIDIGEMLPHELKERDQRRFWEYLRRDVSVLHQALTRFLAELGGVGHASPHPPMTIAQVAYRIWWSRYRPVGYAAPSSPILQRLGRDAYVGGRVDVFRSGRHANVRVYDVNSLYPTVMRSGLFPVDGAGSWTDRYHPGRLGIYRVRAIEQCGRPVYPVSTPKALCSPEIDLIIRCGGRVEIVDGFVFSRVAPIFRGYVDEFWKLRRGTGPLAFVAKLLLNHLYGKFGQRPERTCLARFLTTPPPPGAAPLVAPGSGEPVDGWWEITTPTTDRAFPAIAALVTSYARAFMYPWLADPATIYTDTDSVHTTKFLPVGSEMGQFKLEFGPGRGIYLAPKSYLLKSGRTVKIRMKGVKVGGKLGARLTWRDGLKLLRRDRKLVCRYQSPVTMLECIRRLGTPCVMTRRSRTIRRLVWD